MGIMEKKMDITVVYWGYYIGIMQERMESTM